jgi:hypothetical protein
MSSPGATSPPNPAKIQVGIPPPLTGTLAAVAEPRGMALLAVDVVNKRGGLNMPGGRVMVEGVVADDEAAGRGRAATAARFPRRRRRGRPDLGAACHAINAMVSKGDALFPRLRDVQGSFPEGKIAGVHFRHRVQPLDGGLP